MRIWVAAHKQDYTGRSIYEGFLHAFKALGHEVELYDNLEIFASDLISEFPDLLFVVGGVNMMTTRIEQYRAKGVVTALYLTDEPYEIDRSKTYSRFYDWVFTMERNTVSIHQEKAKTFFLPLAYDSEIFRRDGPKDPSTILITGLPNSIRNVVIPRLFDEFGHLMTFVGPRWKNYGEVTGARYQGTTTREGYATLLRGADVVLNIMRDDTWVGEDRDILNSDHVRSTHLNPRCWEAAACGSFLLSTFRDDARTFLPDLCTFQTLSELTTKLRHYLRHPEDRAKSIERVYAQVQPHTYMKRAQLALEVMKLVEV